MTNRLVRSRATLALDDDEQSWVVVEGGVDLFAVELAGDEYGPRRYLWSAEAGDVIPPAGAGDGHFCWVAVGIGNTRLRAVPFESLGDAEFAPAIDRLVAKLCGLLSASAHPSFDEILTPGARVVLQPNRRAAVREHTVWIRHVTGLTRIESRRQLELTPAQGWIPLHALWVESGGEGATIEVRDTPAQVADGGDLSGLRRLIELLQARLAYDLPIAESRHSERLRAKSAFDRSMWADALAHLVAILEPGAGMTQGAAAARNPLLAACRVVGSAAGIEFTEPPPWEADGDSEILGAICRASRVRSRRVALRGRWWRADAGPLLGYLAEGSAPVALLPQRGGHYAAIDPVTKAQRRVDAEVAAELQPFAVTFARPLPESARSVRDLLAFAVPPVKGDLAGIAMTALVSGLLALAIPVATAFVFNQVIPNARPSDLLTVLVALVATAIGATLFDITRAFGLARMEGRVSAAMQVALVDRLLALPVPFFRRYAVGDLSQRASAVQAVQEAVGSAALNVVAGSVFAIVNLLVLVYYEWRLALLAALLLVIAGAVNAILVRGSMHHERRQQEAQTRVAGFVFQMIAGISRLRVSGSEARVFAVWSASFSKMREEAFRAGNYKVMLHVFNDVLPAATAAVLFGVGGWLMFANGVTFRTGDFVAFATAFGALFAAVVALSNTATTFVTAVAVMEKASPILEAAPEVTALRTDPGELAGVIEATHLSFRYAEESPLVVDDVSFRAEAGQFIAFVGASGSGKSTTLRLLLGFETPETGAVYYDGQDLASLDVSALRNRQFGVVLQSSRLIGGDVFSNIVGASSSLTLDDAWEAAEAAGLADDIRALPMGMHTVIPEGASTFSGGQRQRLLIARALVRKPRIILFDEATSSLDNRTQSLVTRTLELSSATRIVIAHRLSTIRSADRIFVMNRGRVEEEGSFDELAHGRGLFSQLIARQQA